MDTSSSQTTEFRPVREQDGVQRDFGKSYDHLRHFISYWHQIDELFKLAAGRPLSILEIGPGDGFMADYLRKHGHDVKTFDIDDRFRPDYVGSIHELKVPDKSFDVVCCFQVLEHVPFDLFTRSLERMSSVARHKVLFSVPDARFFWELESSFFSSAHILRWIWSFPRFRRRALAPYRPGWHHWEIGRPGYALSAVKKAFPKNIRLERSYRIPYNPYHHLFVLEPVVKA